MREEERGMEKVRTKGTEKREESTRRKEARKTIKLAKRR